MANNETTIRNMIRHEDCLMNYRISWLLQIQGFMLAALGFAWDKQDARNLIYVFSAAGAFLAVCAWSGMITGHKATCRLGDLWKLKNDEKIEKYEDPDVLGYRGEHKIENYLQPWLWFAPLFFFTWLAIAVFNYQR